MAEQRLIDAEALYKKVLGRPVTNVDGYGYINHNRVLEMINNEPTVDAKPVVHAHWKEWYPPKEFVLTGEERLFICSCCDAKFETVENLRYCPNCGAQMDEEENDDG